MPCGCFGKKKKTKNGYQYTSPKGGVSSNWTSVYNEQYNQTSPIPDPATSNYTNDSIMFDYRKTDPSPHLFYGDSHNRDSYFQPPTHPIPASSLSSQTSSLNSSPLNSYPRALSRNQIKEKRRDFFIDLYRDQKPKELIICSNDTSTLPLITRARQFGQVRNMRPLSHPTPSCQPLIESLPPGPHLLRSLPLSQSSSKLVTVTSESSCGLGSPNFLRELKAAAAGISERWARAEEKRLLLSSFEEIPCNESTDLLQNPSEKCIIIPSNLENDIKASIVLNSDKVTGSTNFETDNTAHSSVDSKNMTHPSSYLKYQLSDSTPLKEIIHHKINVESRHPGSDIAHINTNMIQMKMHKDYIEEDLLSHSKSEDDILNELSAIEACALFKKGSVDIYDEKMPEIIIEPSSDTESYDEIITSDDFEIDLKSLSARYTYTVEISPPEEEPPMPQPLDLLEMIERMSSEEEISSIGVDSTTDTIRATN